MPFLQGQSGQTNSVPKDVENLRGSLASWLQRGGIPNFQPGQNTAYTGGGGTAAGMPQPGGSFTPSIPNPQSPFAGGMGSGQQFGPLGGGSGYLGGSFGGNNSPGLDPNAIMANPAGYAQWRQQAAQAGYNYDNQGMQTGGPNIQSASGGAPPWANLDMFTSDARMVNGRGYTGATPNNTDGRTAEPKNVPNAYDPNIQGPQNFDRIFAPPAVQAGSAYIPTPKQFSGAQLDPAAQAQAGIIDRTGLGVNDIMKIMGGVGGAAAGQVGQTPLAQSSIGLSQSVDQLGGANSAFFQNMMQQLQPAFAQQRNLGLAAAKESAGNLTGSGLAGSLGNVVNRSLGDEQARLADYASQGLQTEVGRQMGLVNAENSRNMFNSDQQGQNARLNAQLQTNASIANAGQGSQNALGGLGILAQLAMGQAGNDQQINMFNAQAQNTRGLAQGDNNQRAIELYQNLLGNRNIAQGGYDQQANIFNAGAQNQVNQGNANNFLQMLMGMSTGGVGTPQQTYKPGLGDYLGQALPYLPFLFG